MPRIAGAKTRHAKIFWDTVLIEPGQKKSLFTDVSRVQNRQSNIQIPGQFFSDRAFTIHSLGVRCLLIEHTCQAAAALDHLLIQLSIGDHCVLETYGPQLLMTGERTSGFKLPRPIIVPVRQNYEVIIKADEKLPEATLVRVHIGGSFLREVV